MSTGEINITVSAEDFQHYWRQMKERTALSVSGAHFGHYKAVGHSDFLSEVHALKLFSSITERPLLYCFGALPVFVIRKSFRACTSDRKSEFPAAL